MYDALESTTSIPKSIPYTVKHDKQDAVSRDGKSGGEIIIYAFHSFSKICSESFCVCRKYFASSPTKRFFQYEMRVVETKTASCQMNII